MLLKKGLVLEGYLGSRYCFFSKNPMFFPDQPPTWNNEKCLRENLHGWLKKTAFCLLFISFTFVNMRNIPPVSRFLFLRVSMLLLTFKPNLLPFQLTAMNLIWPWTERTSFFRGDLLTSSPIPGWRRLFLMVALTYHGNPSPLGDFCFDLHLPKRRFLQKVARGFDTPEAALLGGSSQLVLRG